MSVLRRPLYQALSSRLLEPIMLPCRLLNNIISPKVKVDKNPTIADEPFHLTIEDLSPGQKVTLHASVRLPNSAVFESTSHYAADNSGTIHLNRDGSQGGSFTGIEPMGPLSFMVPSAVNKRKYERFLSKDPTKPFNVNFHILDSFIDSLEKKIARKVHNLQPNLTVNRLYMAPGVQKIPIWEERVRGTMYIPPGDGPFPGVLSMSGAAGEMKHKAALLASRGFVAIALKCFGEDDLPNDFFNVDLNYVEEAAVLLRNHPKVDGRNGVGIIANSYGAMIGLGLASVAPKGLIRCVASTNGWPFPGGQFSYNGDKLVNKVPSRSVTVSPEGIKRWKYFTAERRNLLQFAFNNALPIFKRHDTSFMFVVGEKDSYFPATDLALTSGELFRVHSHPNFKILRYEGAGHLIEHSYYPLVYVAWTLQELHDNGGEQPAHSKAQIDSWPKILEFCRRKLTLSTTECKL